MKVNIELTQEILNALFVGKSISVYDSWNGSHNRLENIESVEEGNDSIICSGRNYWKFEQSIYVPKAILETLLEEGEFTSHSSIEGCSIRKEYKLY